jgi:hypothetical protein
MILVVALLGLAPTAAQANRSSFIGLWRTTNSDPAISKNEIREIRITSSYEVWVNKYTYGGTLVSYGTTGAPSAHLTATIVLTSGATTTTVIIGLGTLLNNGSDLNKLWVLRFVDKSNVNSDGNTHRYMTFTRQAQLQRPTFPSYQQLAH